LAEHADRFNIATRLVQCLLKGARNASVSEVRIGLGYMAVRLADGRTGVAYTFRDQARGGCSVFEGQRPLSGRPATDLLRLLESPDVIEAGMGLACANALANRNRGENLDGDVLDHLDLRPEDAVGMVGYFGPLVETIRKQVRSLTVFERVAKPSGFVLPQEEAAARLPGCSVALITATSVINHTIDDLLRAARNCREVAVLGASTPMVPEAFGTARVTMLSGVVVDEPDDVLRVISEAGGMRQFSPYVHKVSMKMEMHHSNLARS